MSQQWDEFSKSLAEESLPRRESLKRLGTVFAGAIFGSVGLKQAVAGRKIDPCTAFCKCSSKKQQNACLTACKACNSDPTLLSGSCGSYSCCGSGTISCDGHCTDLSDDFYNCGSCGYACGEPDDFEYAACVDGRCEYWCADGADYCDGHCTPLDLDYDNCGACGIVCSGSKPYCNNGVCSQCQPGLVACGTICTNLSNDNANCGACGNLCGGSTPYCLGGTCSECPPGTALCDGRCTSILWDSSNCGACGNVCSGDYYVCSSGACVDPVCQFYDC